MGINYPAWYDGPRSTRTEKQIEEEFAGKFTGVDELRFPDINEKGVRYKATASTPLAPPPADGYTPRASKTIGRVEAPARKARAGFVMNGLEQRARKLQEKKRRKTEGEAA